MSVQAEQEPEGLRAQTSPTMEFLVRKYSKELRDRHVWSPKTVRCAQYTLLSFCKAVPADPGQLRRRHIEKWMAKEGARVGPGSLRTGTRWCGSFCSVS